MTGNRFDKGERPPTLSGRRALRVSVILFLFAILAASCGKERNRDLKRRLANEGPQITARHLEPVVSPNRSLTLEEAIEEVSGLNTPSGSDKGLFGSLKAELVRMLLRRDVDKFASGPPSQDPKNSISLTNTEAGLTWNEARWGDWNNDGVVSALDLSPIALFFGRNDVAGDPRRYIYTKQIDGNEDGVVNEGDLGPIAYHFGESTGGYSIYEASDGAGTGEVRAARIIRPPVPADPSNGPFAKSFAALQYDTGTGEIAPLGWKPKVGKWYRVVPYNNTFPKRESETVSSPRLLRREVWAHTWGEDDYEGIQACDSGPSGEIYAAGEFKTGNTPDGLSLRYDSSGNVLWAKSYGSSSVDVLEDVAAGKSGDSYWVGTTFRFGPGVGVPNLLILKRDKDGKILWAKTWGGYGYDLGRAVALDGSGNVYAAGNGFLLKYSPSGDLLWARTWQGGETFSLAVDSESNAYVAGVTADFGVGKRDIYVIKYDEEGSLIWARTWGTSGEELGPRGIAADTDGNVYVTGVQWTSDNLFYLEIFVIKLSSNGELLWDRLWGQLYNDELGDVVVAPDGNLYVVGLTQGNDYYVNEGAIFLLSYDTDGNLLWSKGWFASGGPTSYAMGIACDSNNNLYISATASTRSGSWQPLTGYSRPAGGTTTSPVAPSGAVTGIESTGLGTDKSLTGVVDGNTKADALLLKNYY